MSALSNRNETQYFSKLSRLPLMEHSPTLKLIHTSEVQFGASSTPAGGLPNGSIGSQQKEEDAFARTSLLSRRTPSESAEEGDKASLADHKRLEEHREGIAELQEQIHRRQIKFLQERLGSAKASLTRHLETVKNNREYAELGAASGARAPAQQQQVEKSQDDRAWVANSSALTEHRRNIARLDEQLHKREIRSFQSQLDSSKAALAEAQKILADTQEIQSKPDSEQRPLSEDESEEESDRRDSKTTGKQVRNFLYGVMWVGFGAVLAQLHREYQKRPPHSVEILDVDVDQLGRDVTDAPTSAQELHGETHTTIMPPKESVDLTFIADVSGSEADMHQPTFSVDEPAPEAAKHQPASSWTSLLWKKQS
jgi:5-bromo-4-chloroindolyl phosphate hydrolysis protein